MMISRSTTSHVSGKSQNEIGKYNYLRNSIMLAIVFGIVYVLFHPAISISVIILAGFISIVLLKVNYALGVIILLYMLIPSDIVSYMFIASPFGNFPIYIVLMLLFILEGVIYNKTFSRIITISEFMIYAGLFLVFVLQVICYLVYGSNLIISNLVKFVAQTAGMLLLVKCQRVQEYEIKRICVFLLLALSFTVVVAGLELILHVNVYSLYGNAQLTEWIDWASSTRSIWRAKSTFGNSLVFSSSLLFGLVCIEYLRRCGSKPLNTILWLSAIAIGVLASGSRSSTLILIIYILYLIHSSGIKNKIGLTLGTIVAAFAIYYTLDLSVIVERFTRTASDASIVHRLSAYRLFGRLFFDYFLIGTGLGNSYTVLQNQISTGIATAGFATNTFDNSFMDFGLAVGITGIISIIVSFVGIAKMMVKGRALVRAASLVFIGMSFSLNATKYQSLWGILWLFIALALYSFDSSVAAHEGDQL